MADESGFSRNGGNLTGEDVTEIVKRIFFTKHETIGREDYKGFTHEELLEYIKSDYPVPVRVSAKMKLKMLVRELPKCEKEVFMEVMLAIFKSSVDTWEQRNVLEVLIACMDISMDRRVLSALDMPHIDRRVRERGMYLLIPSYAKMEDGKKEPEEVKFLNIKESKQVRGNAENREKEN